MGTGTAESLRMHMAGVRFEDRAEKSHALDGGCKVNLAKMESQAKFTRKNAKVFVEISLRSLRI